ncbi:SPOR domain-containing protein [Sulfitobacter sp.]|uniref:SPOR domain-containing protein n=1 Tax=Sulfitobacter sp. TaxID=1903071 RepID=UPI003F6C9634
MNIRSHITTLWTRPMRGTTAVFVALLALSGCDASGTFGFGKSDGQGAATPSGSTKLVERDVEAPDVFSANDQGLWDGRPSLGGVWVAHPDVTDPERVIIRNEANGKFVIGALFRRERDLPGPKLQISSDAAAALSILAGAPAPLNVTALRRQEADAPPQDAAPEGTVEAPARVTETALDPVVASASAAIDAAPAVALPTQTAPKPAAPQATSSLAKPFVQIGIFSVEANANRAANQMRSAGMLPTVKRSEIDGKPFWRVVVGPAKSKSELNALLKSIKTEGFSDAYAVSN